MARLSKGGGAHFVILDGVQIYDEVEIDRICARHAISDKTARMTLWRLLEESGQRLRDQRRLQATRVQISRLKQELQLGMRLSTQLAMHLPGTGQLEEDSASPGLSRHHLSALREGERRLASVRDGAGHFGLRLEDAAEALAYLGAIYEAALAACTDSQLADADSPEEAWRATLQGFYTRTLARAWVTRDADQGERFLRDCRMALDQPGTPDQPAAAPSLSVVPDGATG